MPAFGGLASRRLIGGERALEERDGVAANALGGRWPHPDQLVGGELPVIGQRHRIARLQLDQAREQPVGLLRIAGGKRAPGLEGEQARHLVGRGEAAFHHRVHGLGLHGHVAAAAADLELIIGHGITARRAARRRARRGQRRILSGAVAAGNGGLERGQRGALLAAEIERARNSLRHGGWDRQRKSGGRQHGGDEARTRFHWGKPPHRHGRRAGESSLPRP